MNRKKIVKLLDRVPRLSRYDKGTYIESAIWWSFNGSINDTRSFLVTLGDGVKYNETNDWWNYNVDICCLENGYIKIESEYGWEISKEALFNLMPDDVREEMIYEMDALL